MNGHKERTEPLLEIDDLRVQFQIYEGTAQVLDGVSLWVAEGEKVGLVGETGCGKSVTVRSVIGTLPCPPTRIRSGRIRFKGQDLLKLPATALREIRGRQIGMVFQDPMAALNPVFKVRDQMLDVIRHGGRSVSDPVAEALAILEKVQLPNPRRVLESYPFQLSGGMRQRVLIALALVNEPDLLIADEPGTALDVTIQYQILALLQHLLDEKGISVLLITHNLGVVREVTDRVYVMYAGNIVESAPTAELFAHPAHPYTQGLLQAVPKLTGEGITAGIEGMLPDYTRPPSGCRFHPRCPYAMPVCAEEKPPLFRIEKRHEVACFLHQDQAESYTSATRRETGTQRERSA